MRICVSHEVKSHHMMIVDGKQMWNADAKKTGRPMTPVVYKKGCREMTGLQALDYSRQRTACRTATTTGSRTSSS